MRRSRIPVFFSILLLLSASTTFSQTSTTRGMAGELARLENRFWGGSFAIQCGQRAFVVARRPFGQVEIKESNDFGRWEAIRHLTRTAHSFVLSEELAPVSMSMIGIAFFRPFSGFEESLLSSHFPDIFNARPEPINSGSLQNLTYYRDSITSLEKEGIITFQTQRKRSRVLDFLNSRLVEQDRFTNSQTLANTVNQNDADEGLWMIAPAVNLQVKIEDVSVVTLNANIHFEKGASTHCFVI